MSIRIKYLSLLTLMFSIPLILIHVFSILLTGGLHFIFITVGLFLYFYNLDSLFELKNFIKNKMIMKAISNMGYSKKMIYLIRKTYNTKCLKNNLVRRSLVDLTTEVNFIFDAQFYSYHNVPDDARVHLQKMATLLAIFYDYDTYGTLDPDQEKFVSLNKNEFYFWKLAKGVDLS